MYVFYELIEGLAPIPWEVYKVEDVERFRPVSGEGSGVQSSENDRLCRAYLDLAAAYAERNQLKIELDELKAALSSPLQAEHALQSSVSNGAVDPDERWAEVACACGERWKAMGNGSLAWVNKRFNEHVQTVTPPDTKGGTR